MKLTLLIFAFTAILDTAFADSKLSEIYKDEKDGVSILNKNKDTFELLLIVTGQSDPALAQKYLTPVAEQICKGKDYRFDKYEFDSIKAVIKQNENAKDKLFFKQIVICGKQPNREPAIGSKNDNWQPNELDRRKAENVASNFLTYIDQQRYNDAYMLLTTGMKNLISADKWIQDEIEFRKESGGNAKYFNIKVTWYRDPPNAPLPGIYAAFDLECTYENINICSEVLILHKFNENNFKVLRREKNFITKEDEKELNESKNNDGPY